jgi:site-specific recombinase XerD
MDGSHRDDGVGIGDECGTKKSQEANVAISGMKLLYHRMLGRNNKQLFIPPRKRSWQLPEVLSQKEVEHLLLAATKQRDRCLLMTAYATDLRVGKIIEDL